MSEKSDSSSGGIGFFGALGLLFIGLKLGGVIDWSWWFVLLPIYGPAVVVIAIVLLGCSIYAFIQGLKGLFK